MARAASVLALESGPGVELGGGAGALFAGSLAWQQRGGTVNSRSRRRRREGAAAAGEGAGGGAGGDGERGVDGVGRGLTYSTDDRWGANVN